MSSTISVLVARGNALLARDSSSTELSSTVIDLLIALLVLVFILLILTAAIFFMRRRNRRRALARQQLPLYSEKPSAAQHHRSLTISSSRASSLYYPNEKAPRSPTADVPEIRITFPDEHDESGRPRSGRVLLVRVGETSVGLEPMDDEQLPAYEKESSARFHSIDMDRIGGLKESAPTYS